MPKLLQATGPMGKAGWAPFQTLVMAQLQFLEPYLRTARLHESVRLLYQVTPCTFSMISHPVGRDQFPCHTLVSQV